MTNIYRILAKNSGDVMIYEFEVGGLGSVAQLQKIDLQVKNTTPDNPNRYIDLPTGKRVPAVVAFFGPNASGKTTVLSSLMLLKDIATDKIEKENGKLVIHFSECSHASALVHLSASFAAQWLGKELHAFKYKVTIERVDMFQGQIVSEELSTYSQGKDVVILGRNKEKLTINPKLSGIPQKLIPALSQARIPKDTTMLEIISVFGDNNIAKMALVDVMSRVHSNTRGDRFKEQESWNGIIDTYLNNKKVFNRLKRIIRRADVGISDATFFEHANSVEEGRKNKFLLFRHAGLTEPVLHLFESQGTQNFIRLFPTIAKALEVGGIAILDELDSDLHPNLLKEIVSWFHDPEENPLKAQLILTCNNASLLHYLEKDEIYFTEKNSQGATRVYGLNDIQGIERRENFYKKYLEGEYGGLPNFG